MATSVTVDRAWLRRIAAAMAFVMVMASLPSIGLAIVSEPSGPTISMDICHPLQSLNESPIAVPIARPAEPAVGTRILSDETLAQIVPILKCRFAEAPNPPPPKLFC
jgi:hypothetical protein